MVKEIEQDLSCHDHDIDLLVSLPPEFIRKFFSVHGTAQHRYLGIAVGPDDSSLLEDQRHVIDNKKANLALL